MAEQRLIDANALKEMGATCFARRNENGKLEAIISIDNAPTVEPLKIYEFKGCDNCELERPQGEWENLFYIRTADGITNAQIVIFALKFQFCKINIVTFVLIVAQI